MAADHRDIFDSVCDGATGETDRLFELPYSEETAFPMPGPDNRYCCKRSEKIAEWLFFLHCLGFKKLPENRELYQDCRPFGKSCPTLRELCSADQGSVAVFPLAHHEKNAQIARIYLCRGNFPTGMTDMRETLNGDKFFLSPDIKLFCSSGAEEEFDGNSWQLAAALAGKALESEPDIKRKLAWDWIATGTVKGSQVGSVDLIEEKLRLAAPKRAWLLPPTDLVREQNNIHQVHTVHEAWNFVCGGPVIAKDGITLPSKIDIMHVLAGEAASPILSSVLQCWPQEVRLYYTKRSQKNCGCVKDLLKDCGLCVSQPEPLRGENMAEFLEFFESQYEKISGSQVQVINITGGNRLMGFAAMLAATRKQIPMIYREQDGKSPFALQILTRPNDVYFNGVMEDFRCPQEMYEKINWDYLFSKEKDFKVEKFRKD